MSLLEMSAEKQRTNRFMKSVESTQLWHIFCSSYLVFAKDDSASYISNNIIYNETTILKMWKVIPDTNMYGRNPRNFFNVFCTLSVGMYKRYCYVLSFCAMHVLNRVSLWKKKNVFLKPFRFIWDEVFLLIEPNGIN